MIKNQIIKWILILLIFKGGLSYAKKVPEDSTTSVPDSQSIGILFKLYMTPGPTTEVKLGGSIKYEKRLLNQSADQLTVSLSGLKGSSHFHSSMSLGYKKHISNLTVKTQTYFEVGLRNHIIKTKYGHQFGGGVYIDIQISHQFDSQHLLNSGIELDLNETERSKYFHYIPYIGISRFF